MDPDLAQKLALLDQRLDRIEHVLGAFERLTDRADRIEAMVDTLGSLSERMPTISDAAGAGVAFAVREAEARGIDPIATGVRATGLGLELAKAENLALVERLLKRRPMLERVLDAVDGADEQDLVDVVAQGAGLSGRLAKLLKSPALVRVLDALGSEPALNTAEHAATALVEARAKKPEQVGLFAALGRLGDPDVKRAVGFTLTLAKRFGQLLDR